MYKKLFCVGIFTYTVLLVFSVVFYKERFSFIDGSYFLYMMVKGDSFAIQHFRYSAFFVELLPLLTTKAKLPLAVVAQCYSISFGIFYFICFLVCGLALKNYKAALTLFIFSILFTTHTFYWLISEVPQGIAFMVIFFAYLAKNPKKIFSPVKLLISLGCVAIIVFYHPLMIFPFVFAILFFFIRNQGEITRRSLYISAAFFIIFYLVKKVFFAEAYDKQAMGGLSHIVGLFPNYIKLYSNKHFLKNCLDKYYWIPIISIIIFLVYLLNKEWKKMALFTFFTIGYLLFINICYPDNYTKDFYIENLYLPIGLFIALPFVYDTIPFLQERKLSFIIVSLIALTGCIRIYTTHHFYTNRLNWERDFLLTHSEQKLLIDARKAPGDVLVLTWATPYEFWFLSTCENNKTASINFTEDIKSQIEYKDVKDQFLGTWGPEPYATLPKNYFIFKDTSSSYTVIK